ncbi:MAG: C2 family cysteine protease [Bacillota bacterium]
MIYKIFVILVSVFFVASTMLVNIPATAASQYNSNSSLSEIVNSDWMLWSKGNKLSYKELSEVMTNPKYQDYEAAGLAAMCYYLRVNKDKQLDYAGAVDVAQSNKVAKEHFAKFLKEVPNIKRSLYANSLSPNFALLQQGPVGDCFIFSGLGWLAKYRPQVIKNAIQEVSSNNGKTKKYLVSFPNGYRVKIAEPTDSEILFNTSAESITDGLWVTVTLKAIGEVWPKLTKEKSYAEDPTVYLDSGGHPAPFEQLWTGKTPTVYKFNKTGSTSLETIQNVLISINSENLLAQAGGVAPSKDDLPVPGHHVYAILAYDDSSKMLTIWNPWGSDFTPKASPDGPKNGYTRNHGVFQMSLTDFYSIYAYLCVE